VRRAALLLASPQHAVLAAHCTARTVDAIWHAAGDTSADFNWYTKRAILAGVYTSTLFYWMNESTTQTAALDFLARRLAGVARFQKLRTRVEKRLFAPKAVPA
jgi:ubiquinone biosynthesis protein COQ9